jgi:phosphoribosylanthranilate isomerase
VQHGGTGKVADWDFAAELVQATSKRLLLAGGLNPDNVREAIKHVQPYGVDVSSGVEASPGIKERAKVKDFIQAAKSQ